MQSWKKVADGFGFTEGPVWIDAATRIAPDSSEGFLLFSDPNNNLIYRCTQRRGNLRFKNQNPRLYG